MYEPAVAQYRESAVGYDGHMRVYRRWQVAAVERLALAAGDTVIDVACGTGLTFGLMEQRVGPEGRIVGIDVSPDMLEQARARVARHGWANVTLVEAAVEEAAIEVVADAALFSFTHDVLQSPRAVENVVSHLKPGGRVASVGAKLGARWNVVVNQFVRRAARRYITNFEGLDRPWRELERYTGHMKHRDLALGGAYLVSGEIRTRQAAPAASAEARE